MVKFLIKVVTHLVFLLSVMVFYIYIMYIVSHKPPSSLGQNLLFSCLSFIVSSAFVDKIKPVQRVGLQQLTKYSH